jgi:hypothetical protein
MVRSRFSSSSNRAPVPPEPLCLNNVLLFHKGVGGDGIGVVMFMRNRMGNNSCDGKRQQERMQWSLI